MKDNNKNEVSYCPWHNDDNDSFVSDVWWLVKAIIMIGLFIYIVRIYAAI